MEYTESELSFIIGMAIGLAKCENRLRLGSLMDNHPTIFKDIISSIIRGEIKEDYEIREELFKLAKAKGFNAEIIQSDVDKRKGNE